MLDDYSKKQIDKIALELLKSSKTLDIFPTQVDTIVSHADLLVDKGVDLSKIEHSFLSRLTEGSTKFLSNIRGVLDRKKQIIYLDLSQPQSRKNFVKLHETGHHLLSWQNELLTCIDDEHTLSPLVLEEFEKEANYFASAVLFQMDRFHDKVKKLEFSIHAPLHLAKVFGASNHATIRRYVEVSKKRCALLVLEKHELAGNKALYKIRDYFQSEKFTKEFGSIDWPEKFGYKWDFAKDYFHGRRLKTDGEICLETGNGNASFHYHFFNNTYNAFVFIFPLGEHQKSNTKIIIAN